MRCLHSIALITLLLHPAAPAQEEKPSLSRRLTTALESVRRKQDLPAMAAAVVTSRGLTAAAVAGVRKRGEETVATPEDKWHLGSDTKAMTAFLVARLVARGKLKWESPVDRVFPSATPGAANINLLHLLSHRSGLPANLTLTEYDGADGRAERIRALPGILRSLPDYPAQESSYSNLGYILVGAIIEKVTGRSWRECMQRDLFAPLGMTRSGFGGLGRPGEIDQPWPHLADGTPYESNGPEADNPPIMGPAGRVHCTMADWAAFIADLLRGLQGRKALLPAAAYRRLVTPPAGDEWALGWVVAERPWAGGRVYHHAGSNTMNYAVAWVAPERDLAFMACTNQGGEGAQKGVDRAVEAMIGLTLTRKEDRQDLRSSGSLTAIFLLGGCAVLLGLIGMVVIRSRRPA